LHEQLAGATLIEPNRTSQSKSSAVLERALELRELSLVLQCLNSNSQGCYTPLYCSHLRSLKAIQATAAVQPAATALATSSPQTSLHCAIEVVTSGGSKTTHFIEFLALASASRFGLSAGAGSCGNAAEDCKKPPMVRSEIVRRFIFSS